MAWRTAHREAVTCEIEVETSPASSRRGRPSMSQRRLKVYMNPCVVAPLLPMKWGALDLLFFSYDYFEPNMCALSLNILLEKLTKLLKFTSFLILRANFVIFADSGARKEIYFWVC
jgi:hypothetical protein